MKSNSALGYEQIVMVDGYEVGEKCGMVTKMRASSRRTTERVHNMQTILEIRSQHSRGSGNGGFGGPDTYVAVQVVPDGATPLCNLNHRNAALRGITLIYCGEGYSNRCKTVRSMLGAALAKARGIVADYAATA